MTSETPSRPTTEPSVSRRGALRSIAWGAAALTAGACKLDATEGRGGSGRLAARPGTPTQSLAPGLHALGLGGSRDGVLYVPPGYKPATPAPLAVLLHGAGQRSDELVTPMRPLADETGLVLLSPDSRSSTWDAVRGDFGPDVSFIDTALRLVFGRVNVDAARMAIAGFSDGASYSLSMGVINGDLFSRVVGFSPGFIAARAATGRPRFFVTHGTLDSVLPISTTSRVLVPALKNAGYEVEYHEFEGGHGVTEALMGDATRWMAAST